MSETLYEQFTQAAEETKRLCLETKAACDAILETPWYRPHTLRRLRKEMLNRRDAMFRARDQMVNLQIAYLRSLRQG